MVMFFSERRKKGQEQEIVDSWEDLPDEPEQEVLGSWEELADELDQKDQDDRTVADPREDRIMARTPDRRFLGLEKDPRLKSRGLPSRLSKFVIVGPETPTLPTRHPGVDNSLHPTREMDPDHIEMIEHGETTIRTLLRESERGVCPRVLFLISPETSRERAYAEHGLCRYIDILAKERQFMPEFHFAGHGDPETVGSINPEKRVSADGWASILATYFEAHDPDGKAGLFNRPIHFIFHTCNSAYVDVSTIDSADEGTLANKIKADSFIGKFAAALKDAGITRATVSGYRGYYVPLVGRSGVVVQSDLNKPRIIMPAQKAMVTITPDGEVILPKGPGRNFPVHILGTAPRSARRDVVVPADPPATAPEDPSGPSTPGMR